MINNKFFDFSEINNEDIIERMNNIWESYHRQLNNIIRQYLPKLSYLIDVLKEYIYNKYKKYNQSLYKQIDCNIEKINIYKDI